MRGKDLLEKMELADETYIQAANMPVKKKKDRKFFKAAAIILIVGGISLLVHTNYTNINISTAENFSKYSSLNELLEYLGENEKHDSTMKGTYSLSATVSGVDEGNSMDCMYNEYLYHFGSHSGNRTYYEFLQVFNLKEGKLANTIDLAENIHSLYYPTIFIYQNKLILVRNSSLYSEKKTFVNIYSLDNPENPKLEHRYIQNGGLGAAFISDDKLYIFTSDGMCACGFSSKSNPDDYKPSATLDDKEIEWTDDEITVIGEPERVFYSAVSVIDLQNTEIIQKKAFYGDIQDIYVDKDTVALYTKNSFNNFDKPKIDTFDMSDNFSHTSQITINTLGSTKINSIRKIGDSYKIICSTEYISGSSEMVAISADIESGKYDSKKYFFTLTTFVDYVTWNENVASAALTINHYRKDGISVTFNDSDISFEKTDPPTVQHYDGKSKIFEYDGKKFYIDYRKNTLEPVQ